MNKIALVVHSCDAYEVLFKGFYFFFKKYWGSNLPFNCYILTEELTVHWPQFTNIRTGKGPWAARLKKGLENIPETSILYMQEDFWFKSKVDVPYLLEIINTFYDLNSPLLKLHRCEDYQLKEQLKSTSGTFLYSLDNSSNYLMSHQVSLWNKDYLITQLPDTEHPWRNERLATKRMRNEDITIIHSDFFINNSQSFDQYSAKVNASYDTVFDRGRFNQYADHFIDELLIEKEDSIFIYVKAIQQRKSEGNSQVPLSLFKKIEYKLKKLLRSFVSHL